MKVDEIAGGNVFKDANGNRLTRRITREEIPATIKLLEKITNLPLADNILGSAGKKESSKDLDFGVNENLTSKDDLIERLRSWISKREDKDGKWIKKSGITVHFRSPIANDHSNEYLQADFMFGPDVQQMKFGLFSAGDASKFSGADRNLIMSSIAKSLPGDYKYSWQKGLIKRSTGETITTDPDQIARVLLEDGSVRSDLDSVETIAEALRNDQPKIEGLDRLVIWLRKSDNKTPSEIKLDLKEADRITNFTKFIRS